MVLLGISIMVRIKVQCFDNVFFDIFNINFMIDVVVVFDYIFIYVGGVLSECEGINGVFSFIINSVGIGGYSDLLSFFISSFLLGVNVVFFVNFINFGDDVIVILINLFGFFFGNYIVMILSISNVGNKIENFDFEIIVVFVVLSLV